MTTELILTIGRKRYAVPSVEQASRQYQELRDADVRRGRGGSLWPTGKLSNGLTISYNGRVWKGDTLVSEAASNEPEARS